MKCRKCGAELHPEQKVCIQCGTPTPAGGGFHVEEEQPWRPTRNMIVVAAGVLAILVIIMVARGLRVSPPTTVAKDWFSAMAQRKISEAGRYVTDELQQNLQSRNSSLLAVADDYNNKVAHEGATYTVLEPVYDVQDDPTKANVAISLKYPDKSTSEVEVEMVKDGRRWKINRILSGV